MAQRLTECVTVEEFSMTLALLLLLLLLCFRNHINRHTTLLLPPFGEVAHDPYAASAVASAYAALVELQFGADDAVAARAYALPPHAH